jgi:TetR/AcrR family transcriptional regulator, transcriptional repressor for nem operon
MKQEQRSLATRTKLLDAARDVIRAQGYAATTVEDICTAAGVTKGGFFHHFASKEQLGIAAIEQFGLMADAVFSTAPYCADPDPRARVLGYVDLRIAMLNRAIPEFTCLMGTMVQETYATHPDIRAACERGMSEHIAMLTRDLAEAKQRYAPDASWGPERVGTFMQASLHGAFIFAKAKQDPRIAADILGHLRLHLEMLLGQPEAEDRGRSVHDRDRSEVSA